MPASGRLCGLAGPVFDGAVGFNAFKSSARCWIVSALPVFDGLVAFATCLVAFATLDSNIAAGKSFQNLETLERHRKGRGPNAKVPQFAEHCRQAKVSNS
jgi:hypothetical protein